MRSFLILLGIFLGTCAKAGAGLRNLTAFGAPFNPTSIGTLQEALTTNVSGSVHLTGGNVSQWDDQSGNGLHVFQGTAGNRPSTTTVNGKTWLSFSGGQFLSSASDYPQSGDFAITTFTVLKASSVSGDGSPWAFGNTTTFPGTGFALYGLASSTKWLLATADNTFTESGTHYSTTAQIVVVKKSGSGTLSSTVSFRINGMDVSGSGGNALNVTSDKVYVGRYGTEGSAYFNGVIAAQYMYSTAISATNIQRMENWLNSQFSVY